MRLVFAFLHVDVGTSESEHLLNGRADILTTCAVEDVHALLLCQRSSAQHMLSE